MFGYVSNVGHSNEKDGHNWRSQCDGSPRSEHSKASTALIAQPTRSPHYDFSLPLWPFSLLPWFLSLWGTLRPFWAFDASFGPSADRQMVLHKIWEDQGPPSPDDT